MVVTNSFEKQKKKNVAYFLMFKTIVSNHNLAHTLGHHHLCTSVRFFSTYEVAMVRREIRNRL